METFFLTGTVSGMNQEMVSEYFKILENCHQHCTAVGEDAVDADFVWNLDETNVQQDQDGCVVLRQVHMQNVLEKSLTFHIVYVKRMKLNRHFTHLVEAVSQLWPSLLQVMLSLYI